MTREQLDKLPRPPAPKTAPAYDAEQRQTITRTILDLWPPDEEDEDEYLEGLLRIAGFAMRGGAPVPAVDTSMIRRVRPGTPEHSRGFFVAIL